jgi:hypothetical protein
MTDQRQRLIEAAKLRIFAGEQLTIRRLIRLRDANPKLYKKVPPQWKRAVDRYEKDVSRRTGKKADD